MPLRHFGVGNKESGGSTNTMEKRLVKAPVVKVLQFPGASREQKGRDSDGCPGGDRHRKW